MKRDEIPYDGFRNVIEMLHHADSSFRDKIIRNIAKRDPALAQKLIEATKASLSRRDRSSDHFTKPQYEGDGLDDLSHSREVLEKSERALRTRGYGR